MTATDQIVDFAPPPAARKAEAAERVSVVICNYNYGDYVGATIRSALALDWPNLEIIVVDDGSTDHSRDVIRGLADQNPALRVIMQENGGQAAGMNAGFAASTGAYVLFLDSDDLLDPGVLREAVPEFRADTAFVQFLLRTIDAEGRSVGLHSFSHVCEDGDVFRKLAAAGNFRFMPTSGNLFARAALDPVMPMPVAEWRICADTYLVAAAAIAGPTRTVRQVLGSYRVHGANGWHTADEGPERLAEIARNHRQLRRNLSDWLARRVRAQGPVRGLDGHTVLALLRREAEGLVLAPKGTFTGKERRRHALRIARTALGVRAPLGERLLHAGLAFLVGDGGWRSDRAKRLAVGPLRPQRLARLIDALKSADRDAWQRPERAGSRFADAVEAMNAPLLAPGQTVGFGRGAPGQDCLLVGFDQTQSWISWSTARHAALRFRLPAGTGSADLGFTLQPYLSPPMLTRQRVTVRANGHVVLTTELKDKAQVTVRLGRKHLGERCADGTPVVTLEFDLPDAIVPRLVNPGGHTARPVAIGIKTMAIAASHGALPHPHIPVGRRVAAQAGPAADTPFVSGWRDAGPHGAAIAAHDAKIAFTLPNPSMDRFAFRVDFLPVDLPYGGWPVTVSLKGIGEDKIDLAKVDSAVIIVPCGKAPADGRFEIQVSSPVRLPQRVPAAAEGGAVVRGISVLPFGKASARAVIRSGQAVDFRAGGGAEKYLTAGWYPAGTDGAWSGTRAAKLNGFWLHDEHESFATFIIGTCADVPDLADQTVTIAVNGQIVARQRLMPGRNEVFAVLPAGIAGQGRELAIDVRAGALGRPSHLALKADHRILGVRLEQMLIERWAVEQGDRPVYGNAA